MCYIISDLISDKKIERKKYEHFQKNTEFKFRRKER